MSALKIHDYDPRLRDQLGKLVQKKGSRDIQAKFDRDFGAED